MLASVLAGLAMVGAGAMGTPVHADVNLGNSAVNISPNGTYNGSNSVGVNSVVVGYQNTLITMQVHLRMVLIIRQKAILHLLLVTIIRQKVAMRTQWVTLQKLKVLLHLRLVTKQKL